MLMPENDPPKHLLRAEVDAALVSLAKAPAQLARVMKLARLFAHGLTAMDADDLLSKSMTLLLAEKRKWRRDVSTVGVLKGVMRSVASNTRKKLDYVLADDLVTHSDDDGDGDSSPMDRACSSESDPGLIAEAESSLREAVKGDEEVELFLEALADGLTGADIAKELGWDGKTYEAARKRLSRRLAVLKTDWRTP
jgi:hypothetical protein